MIDFYETLLGLPRVLLIIFEIFVLFNLLIIVHELGHFLAAKWRGLVIEKFGIWFGKPLWKKTIDGVEYSLGCIPAGGFVALPQMAPMETIEGKSEIERESLPPAKPMDRIIVAFAGPLFSFMLAIVMALIVWQVGRPVSDSELTTTIGYVEKNSTAEKYGLQVGDVIEAIDGHPIKKFGGISTGSISWHIVSSEGENIRFDVLRDGQKMSFDVEPEIPKVKYYQRKALRRVGIHPKQSLMVAEVVKNSPAEQAGLKPSDIITHLDGIEQTSMAGFSDALKAKNGSPVKLDILRKKQTIQVTLAPAIPKGEKNFMIGIVWDQMGDAGLLYPHPVEQIYDSVTGMYNTIMKLISPTSDIKPQHLSGPLGILRIYYRLFESEDGWRMALWFSVVVNINLAIMNLIPFPVLDGGHIMLAFFEIIMRRPINTKIMEITQTACALLLIGFILYVSFFDIQDYSFGFFEKKERDDL